MQQWQYSCTIYKLRYAPCTINVVVDDWTEWGFNRIERATTQYYFLRVFFSLLESCCHYQHAVGMLLIAGIVTRNPSDNGAYIYLSYMKERKKGWIYSLLTPLRSCASDRLEKWKHKGKKQGGKKENGSWVRLEEGLDGRKSKGGIEVRKNDSGDYFQRFKLIQS